MKPIQVNFYQTSFSAVHLFRQECLNPIEYYVKRVINGFLVLLIFVFAGFADAQTALKDKDLPNFAAVKTNFFRGGQPTEAGVKKLAAMGVKTIIDLRAKTKRRKRKKIGRKTPASNSSA